MSFTSKENLGLFPLGGANVIGTNSKKRFRRDLERIKRDLERSLRSLSLGFLAVDGRRALGISLIGLCGKGFDIWA